MDPIDRRYLDFSPQTHGLTLDMTGVGWVQERRISFTIRPGRPAAPRDVITCHAAFDGVLHGWDADTPPFPKLRPVILSETQVLFLCVVERSPCSGN